MKKILMLIPCLFLATAAGVAAASPMLISAGFDSTCGIGAAGELRCYGDNSVGQITGSPTATGINIPTTITGMTSGVTAVRVSGDGHHICAVKAGQLYCWGQNDRGQLGLGDTVNRALPTLVPGMTSITSLGLGARHTCATVSTGGEQNYCWGDNAYGQLGIGTTGGNHYTPVFQHALQAFQVDANRNHTCLLVRVSAGSASKYAYCWGRNDYGQLGDGSTATRTTEGPAILLPGYVSKLSTAWDHTCALIASGAAYCWGNNTNGQIGDNTTTMRLSPVAVSGGLTFYDISAGGDHTIAAVHDTSSEVFYTWGWGGHGQQMDGGVYHARRGGGWYGCAIGNECDHHVPYTVWAFNAGLLTSLSAGGYHTTMVSGTVFFEAGGGSSGQLGNGLYNDEIWYTNPTPFGW